MSLPTDLAYALSFVTLRAKRKLFLPDRLVMKSEQHFLEKLVIMLIQTEFGLLLQLPI